MMVKSSSYPTRTKKKSIYQLHFAFKLQKVKSNHSEYLPDKSKVNGTLLWHNQAMLQQPMQ